MADANGTTPMNITKDRIEITERLDVDAFRSIVCQETGVAVPHDIALASLHKTRCELARRGLVSAALGAESGEWLEQRGMHQGVRWWRVDERAKTNH